MASKQLLTTKQVIAGFAVGHMTIYNWRKGTAKQDPLPTVAVQGEDGNKVMFSATDVKAWAKKYERPFTMPTGDAEVVKPGPKPKAPAVKAAKAPAAKTSTKSSKTGRKIAAVAKKAERKTKSTPVEAQASA